jgi:DMSO/TMAO reductase YedYZ molybdopterin-dependent catalytic subunit
VAGGDGSPSEYAPGSSLRQPAAHNVAVAGRRTNLGLLMLLSWALASGFLAFAIGQGWDRWVVVAHGAVGLGILVLAPWKSVVVRRGLRRHRPGAGWSVALSILVAVAILTGIGHATGLLRSIGPLTSMQIHVSAALASIPFAVWHLAARPVRPRRTDLGRRSLLRAGALSAGSLAAFGGLAGAVRLTGLPGRSARFTGSYSAHPRDIPVTQWLTDSIPMVDSGSWRLRLLAGGREVERLSLAELEPLTEPVRATLDCTGGWFADQLWEGVRLDRLLARAGIGDGRSIRAVSITGYDRRFPVADAGRLWLATRAGGEPLAPGHGAPARMVVPGRRGFWWVKWVTTIEVDHTPWWWQPPFPLR